MPGQRPESVVLRRFLSLCLFAGAVSCVFSSVLAFAQTVDPKSIPGQVQLQESEDPCPTVKDIFSGKTPDDLSLVQADIDRYTLCAKRAELLKKLNELTTENEKAVNQSGASNPGMVLDPASLPKIPSPPVAPPPLAPFAAVSVPEDDGNWRIVEIFGASGNLQAKLVKSDGSVARVKAGSDLSDGGKVIAITPIHVTIRGSSGETELSWQE